MSKHQGTCCCTQEYTGSSHHSWLNHPSTFTLYLQRKVNIKIFVTIQIHGLHMWINSHTHSHTLAHIHLVLGTHSLSLSLTHTHVHPRTHTQLVFLIPCTQVVAVRQLYIHMNISKTGELISPEHTSETTNLKENKTFIELCTSLCCLWSSFSTKPHPLRSWSTLSLTVVLF